MQNNLKINVKLWMKVFNLRSYYKDSLSFLHLAEGNIQYSATILWTNSKLYRVVHLHLINNSSKMVILRNKQASAKVKEQVVQQKNKSPPRKGNMWYSRHKTFAMPSEHTSSILRKTLEHSCEVSFWKKWDRSNTPAQVMVASCEQLKS